MGFIIIGEYPSYKFPVMKTHIYRKVPNRSAQKRDFKETLLHKILKFLNKS